jgi:UDP-sugar transporter A1/2/3
MLGKRFSAAKSVSLVWCLRAGEVSGSSDRHNKSSELKDQNENPFVGFVAVLAASCTSGFAGVYFEMISKESEVTLWMRNIQMGLFSITIAFLTAIVQESAQISQKGFFVGYSPIVVTAITTKQLVGCLWLWMW